MVDPDMAIAGIIDTGKVITFTALEASEYGFCDGIVDNVQELIEDAALKPAVIKEYKPTRLDKLIGMMMHPVFQSLLIMAIFGGIYFELQTPGVGFPLGIAILAAVLYFAPLYLEGIAANWEIVVFILGILLIALELFVIPGFGVAGVSGIILAIIGLSLAMVDAFDFDFEGSGLFVSLLLKSMLLVIGSIFVSFLASLYLSKRLFESSYLGSKISLQTVQTTSEGYLGVDASLKYLIGKQGITENSLRPSGTVIIDGETYDAKAEFGFIEKGQNVVVTRYETSQIYVMKI
jgi:membrane-bound serine protease (ClpP class)